MAGQSLRNLKIVVFIFLALTSGWMVVQTEGRTCYKHSDAFIGPCIAATCAELCISFEKWDDGFCSGDKCTCTKQCAESML
ncbi:defensin-like protein 5 [Cucurbita maxima]|uniref:Defensin-like protein 5 n=1 Tax=Cucurbita maxima TaxID=3661 RepID=A0A6J1IBG0_CUCMA|nr:defensin-like protein 5 [Cucurbita maxima]XP_022974469.1 defensin-like protein 5 [Cucurbita maxima]XP_022974470.1 defensin-like protein 5 [Cucurbita maxima]XP_022974471.1 defensin-like protein 5 [Cucurbita maxima]XP_022974694.1 defensin-like protein 5 [Cucurbita maxima]XP_022974695.1 defensin-like protein 5 [Cucurbita maxima]XP_022974696.1 defensin-like protein 5 [Cucurbita maxima]XP_022974697.1 defensin-like protein 5 [Cucurbita maxima]XP_022974698.1 defensin-like protein 5 [Cucurbita m